MRVSTKFCAVLLTGCLGGNFSHMTHAQEAAPVNKAAINEMVGHSVEYLKLRGQDADGSFSKNVGITAVVAAGLTAVGTSADDPVVKKAFDYLMTNIQPDGGIYVKGSAHANYETCISVMAFNRANKSGKYTEVIMNAEKFIRKEQWDESENITTEDLKYGGAGYGSKARPDMSNTAFMLETLHELGAGKDDPAIQRALTFVTRCQNLESPQTPLHSQPKSTTVASTTPLPEAGFR